MAKSRTLVTDRRIVAKTDGLSQTLASVEKEPEPTLLIGVFQGRLDDVWTLADLL